VVITLPPPDLAEIMVPVARFDRHPATGRTGFSFPAPPRAPQAALPVGVEVLPDGNWFVASALAPIDFVRQHNWMHYASTAELLHELKSENVSRPKEIRAVIHARMTQPATLLVLTLLGVPFVMQWDRRTVYSSLVAALALSCGFFVLETVAQYVAGFGYIEPAFAAWTPIFVFGPLAAALAYRIGT
jgi:lipopolysaccharide export system permease protein